MSKILACLFCLTLFLAGGCGSSVQEKSAPLPKLTIGLMPDTDSIPFIIAAERGYFAEEGVEVELQPLKSAMDRDAALQSGNLDGAVSDLLAVIFARSGGFDVRAVSYTDGNYNLVASDGAGIAASADLRGKEIAVSKNTIIEYVTDEILAANGMREEDVAKVVIPQIPVRLEMLRSGNLGAAVLPEPMASVAAASGSHYVIGSGDLGINPGVIVFSKSALQDKEKSVRAMYRAYNKAVDYLNNTPQSEYLDLVVERSGFPPAARDVLVLPSYRYAGSPAESDVAEAVRWVTSKGNTASYGYDDLVSRLLSEEK